MKKSKIEKSIEQKNIFQNRMLSIYKASWKNNICFNEICERVNNEIFNTIEYKKLQVWAKNQLRGYSSCLLDMSYNYLVWSCEYKGKFRGATKNFKYGKNFDQSKLVCFYVYTGTQNKF